MRHTKRQGTPEGQNNKVERHSEKHRNDGTYKNVKRNKLGFGFNTSNLMLTQLALVTNN